MNWPKICSSRKFTPLGKFIKKPVLAKVKQQVLWMKLPLFEAIAFWLKVVNANLNELSFPKEHECS